MSAFLQGLQTGMIHYMIGCPFGYSNPFMPVRPFWSRPLFTFNPFFNAFNTPLYNPNFLMPQFNFYNLQPRNNYIQYDRWEPANFTFRNPAENVRTTPIIAKPDPSNTVIVPYVSQPKPETTIGDTFTRSSTDYSTNVRVISTITGDNTSKKPSSDNSKKTQTIQAPKTTHTTAPTTQAKTSTQTKKTTVARTNGDFDKMLNFVLRQEGGWNHNERKYENGVLVGKQSSYRGVLESSYKDYRIRRNLPVRPLKALETDEAELKNIYYEDYYLAIGADKIKDPTLALYVFDSAVNHGVSGTKSLLRKSGYNADNFLKARIIKYCELSKVKVCDKKLENMTPADFDKLDFNELMAAATSKISESKNENFKGWLNRIKEHKNQAQGLFCA